MNTAAGQQMATQGSLQAARSDLDQAKADLTKAALDYQRAEALYAAKAMTRPDYDSAVARRDAAAAKVEGARRQIEAYQGQLEAAQAQVESAKISLGDTNLTAPMASVILSKSIEPGSLVAAGTTGFTIADTRVVKVEFGVPDSVLANFKMGAALPVRVEALQGRTFRGRITEIAASASRESRAFNIQVSLPNGDRSLKVGMIASVEIVQGGESRKLPIVPLDALATSQSGSTNYSVFTVRTENGKQFARLRSVRIGDTIGRSVAIEEGITPGERIIVSRTNQLADGSLVQSMQ